jgi:hypothetical protein
VTIIFEDASLKTGLKTSLKRGVFISIHMMEKPQNFCELKLYSEGVPSSDLCGKTHFSH